MAALIEFLESGTIYASLVLIALYFLGAYVVHRRARRLGRFLASASNLTNRGEPVRLERLKTLRGLYTSIVSFLAFGIAIILTLLVMNVDPDTIIWVICLFTAAFGLGARPLVSDFLTGVSFLFEDPFDVGDKVELMGEVQGVVESVNMRTTQLRAHSGETFTVPNGEIRLIRNFSRGRFSLANIKLVIPSASVDEAVPILEQLGRDAVKELPNLLEPWKVISEAAVVSQDTELTLVAKARFGRAAEMRPRLISLVQNKLEEAGVKLADI